MSYLITSAVLRNCFVYRRGSDEIPVYPLTIGVTGRRRIAPSAVEAVRAQTRELLTRLAEYWRKEQGARGDETSPAPVVVFNGLATGGDALVAEEVLRLKETRPELNLRLVAVAPAPTAIYEQDFEPGRELDAFRQLWTSADATVEIPLTEENRRWLEENPDARLPDELRKAQYETLGRSLAESSLYVLALWDGIEARLENGRVVDAERGGTADVVRMKTATSASSIKPPFQIETELDWAGNVQAYGGVFQVATPRDGETSLAPGLKVGQYGVYLSQKTEGESVASQERRRAFDSVDEIFAPRWSPTKRAKAERQTLNDVKRPLRETAWFNRDAVANYEKTRDARQTSVGYLLGDDYAKVGAETKFLVERYAVADTLSTAFQARFFRLAAIYLSFLAVLAAVSCAFSLKTETGKGWLGLAYYLALFALWLIYFGQRRWEFYERHHRYRALAEALRVQIFWRVAGIADDVRVGYWTHQIKELNWLHFIVQSGTSSLVAEPKSADFGVAFTRWVCDQREFLENRVEKFRRLGGKWEKRGRFFTWIAVLGLLARVVPHLADWRGGTPRSWTIVLAASGFLALASFTWNRLKSYGSQRKRYARMAPIYRCVEETLAKLEASEGSADAATLVRDRQTVLRYLGAVALSENADWFLAKRRLELPK